MSKTGPPVDLARGDRVGLFRVLTILGHGEEGVAATVLDEFLQIERVLKAYPAEAFWVDRLKFVSSTWPSSGSVQRPSSAVSRLPAAASPSPTWWSKSRSVVPWMSS